MSNLHSVVSRNNPYELVGGQRGVLPVAQRPAETLTAQTNARAQLLQQPKETPFQRLASPGDLANARELTSPTTVTAFENRLNALNVQQLPNNAQPLGRGTQFLNYLKKAGNMLVGKGNTAGEIHGVSGLSAAYAANTKGGIADLSASLDPSRNVNTALGLDGDGKPTAGYNEKLDKAISGNFDDNNGAKAGAAIGGVVAAIGLYNGIKQFNSANKSLAFVAELDQQANNYDQIAQHLTVPTNLPAALNLLQPIQLQLQQNANNPDLPAPLTQQIQAQEQRLGQQIAALQGLPGPAQAQAIQELRSGFRADARVIRELGSTVKSDANWSKFEAGVAIGANANGLVNAFFTAASAIAKSGNVYNGFSSLLIVTQAISGVGMVVGGTAGMVKNFRQAKTSHEKIQAVDTFMQNLAAPNHANPLQQSDAVQRQEELKDVAKLVRAENVSNRRHKIFNFIKSGLVVAAGVALTVGVLAGAAALAATPVGWALGGAAAVMGIGYGIYRLVQKHNQKKLEKGLETQLQRTQLAKNGLAPVMNQEPAILARQAQRATLNGPATTAGSIAERVQQQQTLQARADQLVTLNGPATTAGSVAERVLQQQTLQNRADQLVTLNGPATTLGSVAELVQQQQTLQARVDQLDILNGPAGTVGSVAERVQQRQNLLANVQLRDLRNVDVQTCRLRIQTLVQQEKLTQSEKEELQILQGSAQQVGSLLAAQQQLLQAQGTVDQEAPELTILNGAAGTVGSIAERQHQQQQLTQTVQNEAQQLATLTGGSGVVGSIAERQHQQQQLTLTVQNEAAQLGTLNGGPGVVGSVAELQLQRQQLAVTVQNESGQLTTLNANAATVGSVAELQQQAHQLQGTLAQDQHDLTQIADYRELSMMESKLSTHLRQTSPKHAIATLVTQLRENNPDAQAFAQNVLGLPANLANDPHADPIFLAELIKRKMGLVYG